MQLKIKKLRENAILPTRGSRQAAGYDLYACLEAPLTIAPGQTAMVPFGFAVAIPEGYFGGVFARSGLSSKQGLRPANCTGVIDSDYRGECMVPLYNDSGETRTICHGDRVAQLVVLPYLSVEFEETDALDETQRGEGGFGSTGQ